MSGPSLPLSEAVVCALLLSWEDWLPSRMRSSQPLFRSREVLFVDWHHFDVEVFNPSCWIWVEQSKVLVEGVRFLPPVHITFMLSTSIKTAQSRLSPLLGCDLVLSTEFATASVNLRGNIVWPTCSSTTFVHYFHPVKSNIYISLCFWWPRSSGLWFSNNWSVIQ